MAKLTKESTVYLNFLKSFWWLFLIFAITGGVVGWKYGLNQPPQFSTQVQLEVSFDSTKMTSQALIADQVVGVLRSRPVQQQLGINPDSQVAVHKNGPLLINLLVKNPDIRLAERDAEALTDLAVNKYQLSWLGTSLDTQNNQQTAYKLAGIGMAGGLLIALAGSLLKTYLKNH